MSLNAFILCFAVVSALWVFGNCSTCDEPKQTGPCKARIPRFYFNRFYRRCERFYWGGCRPNGNNFATEQACNAACVAPNVNACDQPKKVGTCKALVQRYFFNKINGRCESFNWGGCGANGNNFPTKLECIKACAGHRKPRRCFNSTSGECKFLVFTP